LEILQSPPAASPAQSTSYYIGSKLTHLSSPVQGRWQEQKDEVASALKNKGWVNKNKAGDLCWNVLELVFPSERGKRE